MTGDNWLVLGILAVAIGLFVTDRLRVDLVALLVLVTLILTGLLPAAAAFEGFASPAVVTVWAVFIISGAVSRSGVADMLARLMMRLAGRSPRRLLLVLMLTAGTMSAFMNNIGAVAILLPAVVSMGRQIKIPPSKLLMPLAFAALLGGNITLVGTPPNILASALLEDYGHVETFGFFDFAPTGLLVLAVGTLYMMLVGYRLLPERTPGQELVGEYPVREYLSEVRVQETSPLVDKTLAQAGFGEKYDLNILRARRDDVTILGPDSDRPLRVGDVLLVEGSAQDIMAVSQAEGLALLPDWSAETWQGETAVDTNSLKLAEITLAPNSHMEGATLREIGFRAQYGLSVVAMRHDGQSMATRLGDVPLHFGDALLVQGQPERVNLLRHDANFLVLEMPPLETRRTEKAPLTIFLLLAVLVAVTVGWFDTSTTLLMGALLMVLTGVLSMDEAYQSIDWKAVFLIAGMLPLGVAMETTGTARLLADQLVRLVGGLGPTGVLAGMFLLTALLTEVISNAAATVLMVPIAIDAAFGLGVSPQ
ncbi:MAG: SLC13 family permease, partial [Anaerolineales bacterium]|nr:SLC13 family permease [Anaerolineales bacterium]